MVRRPIIKQPNIKRARVRTHAPNLSTPFNAARFYAAADTEDQGVLLSWIGYAVGRATRGDLDAIKTISDIMDEH